MSWGLFKLVNLCNTSCVSGLSQQGVLAEGGPENLIPPPIQPQSLPTSPLQKFYLVPVISQEKKYLFDCTNPEPKILSP